MKWLAGIDGGGTSTRLEIRDTANQSIADFQFGPFNISSIGESAFCDLLQTLWTACPPMADCVSLCIGGAGVSSPAIRQLVEHSLAARGFSGTLTLCSDFEIALRGAINGPGCILIAGTGSVGFGQNADGQSVRVGGWGHLIDDLGSGYALGRAALALTVQTLDGRADAHTLSQAICKATSSQSIQDILKYVYYSGRDKSAVAALAKTLIECAQSGDENSMDLLRQGVSDLSCIVQTLSRRLAMPFPQTALLGGLLAHDSVYRTLAVEELSKIARVVPALHDALWGAAQLAYEKL